MARERHPEDVNRTGVSNFSIFQCILLAGTMLCMSRIFSAIATKNAEVGNSLGESAMQATSYIAMGTGILAFSLAAMKTCTRALTFVERVENEVAQRAR